MAVLLFFGQAYPHHLHYQEQYQLFLFDSTYVWDVVRLPGGIADLLGRFCTQFFLFAWVGALIIAILLLAIQLLTLRLVNSWTSQVSGWLYGLSFVPSFLLWLFLLDENALLGGVWAVLLTLLAAWVFDSKRSNDQTTKRQNNLTSKRINAQMSIRSNPWTRRILLIVAVPVLYWMVGPVCVLFFLLQALCPKHDATSSLKSRISNLLGLFVLLAIMLVVLAHYIPIPADRLWTGIHYHRYPTVIPVLLWSACLSVFVFILLARICHHSYPSKATHGRISRNPLTSGLSPLTSFIIVSAVMGWFVWNNGNFKAEKVMQYDFMARHQQWNRILETVNAEKPNNQIGVTVQNLALAMRGMLVDHLFDYNQNGIAGLLPDVQSDATSPLPTAEAFYQLGMIHVAQRTVFEAQEAILDFQKSARCYKRLAQTNLIIGSYEVARKYLMALQKTLFYSEWAEETLPLLGNEEAIASHPEYGHLRQWAYKEDLTSGRVSSHSAVSSELDGSRLTGDFYFSDHVTPEMLESLFFSNTDNHLAYDYLRAYYLLTDDREGYAKLLLYLQNAESEE